MTSDLASTSKCAGILPGCTKPCKTRGENKETCLFPPKIITRNPQNPVQNSCTFEVDARADFIASPLDRVAVVGGATFVRSTFGLASVVVLRGQEGGRVMTVTREVRGPQERDCKGGGGMTSKFQESLGKLSTAFNHKFWHETSTRLWLSTDSRRFVPGLPLECYQTRSGSGAAHE